MVLLHFKLGEKNQFIIETTTNTPITDILKKGIELNNLRCKIDTLCMVIEELMKHGPLKTEETRGLKETENLDENIEPKYRAKKTPMPPKVGTKYNEDNRFIFINAWNNYYEGTYLEPDEKFGYGSINALSHAIFDLPRIYHYFHLDYLLLL